MVKLYIYIEVYSIQAETQFVSWGGFNGYEGCKDHGIMVLT